MTKIGGVEYTEDARVPKLMPYVISPEFAKIAATLSEGKVAVIVDPGYVGGKWIFRAVEPQPYKKSELPVHLL